MKYLIVGLGNIGAEYENTRHNIGFNVLEALANASNTVFTLGKHAHHCTIQYKGRTLVLIKPTTYMNLSGKAVNHWLIKEKIPFTNLLVVTDDLALPFGKLRLRGKGSDGGHNGLKDINFTLSTNQYARLRFGIGSEFNKGNQVNYVLGKWDATEQQTLEERINLASDCVLSFCFAGLQNTMTKYNAL
ncbi:MAG: aminoacyl-tRNA hydrolase [Luteibaculaceae bacterium]